ncbi:MAG: dipeptidyl aminopeptidase/acylaminoacyl peptidase [Spirosomataceae bacterium]|jgi:dipeptidyl aminopeptidase/acylaminoacyl peptidase
MKKLLLVLLLGTFTNAFAQKRPLSHADYDGWKSIQNTKITNDGKWTIYEENPQDGDGSLIFYPMRGNRLDSIKRGQDMELTADDAFAIFYIVPPKDSVTEAKRKKVKKDDMPKKALGIYELSRNNLTKVPDVNSFKIPEKQSGWLAYHLAPQKAGKDSTKTAKKIKKESSKLGSKLILQNLTTNNTQAFTYVTGYEFPKYGTRLAYVTTGDDSTQKAGVYVIELETGTTKPVFQAKGKFTKLSFSEDGKQLAFVADLDTNETTLLRNPQLMFWKAGNSLAKLIADSTKNPAPNGWLVSSDYSPKFSKDGSKLFFGTIPRYLVKDTTVLEEDIVEVDIWNYQDTQLMTQQLANLDQEKKRSYLAVMNTVTNGTTQLATLEIPLTDMVDEGNADFVLAGSNLPYSNQHWDWSGTGDIYTISTRDGQVTKVATAQKTGSGGGSVSPKGKYVYWYSKSDTAWFANDVRSGKTIQLTSDTGFSDAAEDDHPDYPSPYGVAGWSENDNRVLIYDRYDIWSINPDKPSDIVNLTKGAALKTRYRYVKLDDEERSIDTDKALLLHLFDEKSKQSGYAQLSNVTKQIIELAKSGADYSRKVYKAKKAGDVIFTKETFNEFPDLYAADNLTFSNIRKLSDVNPQQANINWGTVEMVNWKSLNGDDLEGLLYKPEGFDPTKKYPMITYYYEKNSDNLYSYHVPQPIRASVNYSYYVSNGYILFVPDIVYQDGYPGKSAYDCLMPGVLSILDKGFVDEKKLGLQGHSWGGYQNAYLITQTNLFAAAEAGAPVANMTSAYGGIRWDSGLSRQAQYESNQSRIGGTLWDKPMQYIENSPLFYIPKIETPLLMMHNDADGAVPWYQGIEMFMGMKRLDKPVWLLNYNGEKHGLTKRRNRKDWTQRMSQFFDYYLKDAPIPVWMKSGVPAVNKTLDYGFGLEE